MIERIHELPYNAILPSNAKFPFYLPDDDTTYHVNAGDFISGLSDPGDAWNEFAVYGNGALVTYAGAVWISTVGGNTGNPPGPASLVWDEEPDPPQLGGLVIRSLDTSNPAIVVNMEDEKEFCFIGSVDIDEPKTWSFINTDNFVLIPFVRVSITGGLHVQSLPVGTKIAGAYNALWDKIARTWEPLAEGDYEMRVTYDQSEFWITIAGPY